jgi:hypothetical protein
MRTRLFFFVCVCLSVCDFWLTDRHTHALSLCLCVVPVLDVDGRACLRRWTWASTCCCTLAPVRRRRGLNAEGAGTGEVTHVWGRAAVRRTPCTVRRAHRGVWAGRGRVRHHTLSPAACRHGADAGPCSLGSPSPATLASAHHHRAAPSRPPRIVVMAVPVGGVTGAAGLLLHGAGHAVGWLPAARGSPRPCLKRRHAIQRVRAQRMPPPPGATHGP